VARVLYRPIRSASSTCLTAVLICSATILSASPGFGLLRKKTLTLKTRQPAVVRLANTSIAFRSAYTNPEYASVVASLATALGTELVSNERSLVVKDNPAEAKWVLKLTVTGYSVAQPSRYTEGSGNTAMTYVHWSGSLNAAYQVLDASGRVYDASNVASSYNENFPVNATTSTSRWSIPGLSPHKGSGNDARPPNSPEDVKQDLIHDVVEQIAAKLGNTTRAVEVQIATGDPHLDRAAEFMQQALWSRAVDELEKTPPFPKPDQEAYRQYDLGLAYEAISYSSTNSNDQKENIFKAAEYYDKAVEMNVKEKYFVETVARTRDALARYKELEKQDHLSAKSGDGATALTSTPVKPEPVTTTQHAAATSPAGGAESPSGKTLTVNDVIEMYNDKVPEEQIVDVIQGSNVDFNPHDKDTVIAIAKAKLPVALQNALRKKVGAPPLKPASTSQHSPTTGTK
jgi:hypothetical protein